MIARAGSVLSGFDRVVFGCDATHALAAMGDDAGWLARQLLSRKSQQLSSWKMFRPHSIH